MSEKFYVVSESELKRLKHHAVMQGIVASGPVPGIKEAESACRAREVPEWATHLDILQLDNGDICKGDTWQIGDSWEIKR